MQVNNVPGENTRPEAVQKASHVAPVIGSEPGETPDAERGAGIHRDDQVYISDAGRALAGDTATGRADSAVATGAMLDPKRADDIRAKILSGAYDSLAMASDVARAILRSGDL